MASRITLLNVMCLCVFLSLMFEAVNRFSGNLEDYQIEGRPNAVIFRFRQFVITALLACGIVRRG
jgi:hypothetical protein